MKVRFSSTLRRLSLAWLALLVLFVLYWVQLCQSYSEQIQNAEHNTRLRAEQAAHALAMQARSELIQIQFFMDHLTEHWMEDDPAAFARLIELGQKSIFKGTLSKVLVADTAGNIVFNSRDYPARPSPGVSIADREYFQQHIRNGTPFVISHPVQNRHSGEWTVQLSLAHVVDGRFAGATVLSVTPEHLAEAFLHIYPHRDDVVVMLLSDGRYLTRSQDLASHLAHSVPATRPFILEPETENGHYQTIAPIDGIERHYAWHRVPDFPVVLTLGLNREHALADVLASIRDNRYLNLVVTVLIAIIAIWLTRYTLIRVRHHRLVVQNQERIDLLLRRFPSGVLLEDENGCLVTVNTALCRLLGLQAKPEQLQGLHHDAFVRLLDAEHAQCMSPPSTELAAGYRAEIEESSGRILALECIPITHDERNMGYAWFVLDVSSRKQKERELEALANLDPLTGLLNRRSFMELLENSAQFSQPHRPGALLLLDIDHFKRVNDSYGHPAGDQVLKNVAHIIQHSLRDDDHAGRLGGEEFAVLLPTASRQEALQRAERIRAWVEGTVTGIPGHAIRVTVSIGIAQLREHSAETIHEMADIELYRAKNEGRNRVCMHRSS